MEFQHSTFFLSLAFFLLSCQTTTTTPVDLQKEKKLLLQSNTVQKEAHLEGDASKLVSQIADTITTIQKGEIYVATKAETLHRFTNYFHGVRYQKWDDLAPPLVSISEDATQALVAVKKVVKMDALAPDNTWREQPSIQFAWTANYKKINGKWKIFMITSTQTPSDNN